MAKLSISIPDDDLRWLRQRAKRMHGGNVSAAISEQTRLARHHEALGAMLDGMGVPALSERESATLIAEIDDRRAPSLRRRKRAA